MGYFESGFCCEYCNDVIHGDLPEDRIKHEEETFCCESHFERYKNPPKRTCHCIDKPCDALGRNGYFSRLHEGICLKFDRIVRDYMIIERVFMKSKGAGK
jgi:hypothetical protein